MHTRLIFPLIAHPDENIPGLAYAQFRAKFTRRRNNFFKIVAETIQIPQLTGCQRLLVEKVLTISL